ncbi:protein-L-isoaspartate(D-aspartate) O-methyltransferase [Tautonia rosea]|uniref:protein-L-isoaspartate(D-aspartate) O-methyltransferase n=1 Tax=Tautonia rosea TaxID=2728037 RepID=UPI0019D1ABE2|nr:protein-L-isoaspartate(D-aspartate) O-methyltransferase [Tautonia rosea]
MNAPSLATFQPSFVGLLGWLISLGPVLACVPGDSEWKPSGGGPPAGGDDDPYVRQRARMVADQLRARDIDDPRVLEVMARVPRHEFVSESYRDLAYTDRPLPIEKDQTISQPYIVALMTQLARPQPGDRALDVGTGSGYQAAVLAKLVDQVYSIEIHKELADSARGRLFRLGDRNVEVRHGDGYRGWPEAAPFDLIIVAASPPEIPKPLIDQLAPGGRLILPVGEGFGQELVRIEKAEDGTITRESIAPVSFVPMTGEARHGTDWDR